MNALFSNTHLNDIEKTLGDIETFYFRFLYVNI